MLHDGQGEQYPARDREADVKDNPTPSDFDQIGVEQVYAALEIQAAAVVGANTTGSSVNWHGVTDDAGCGKELTNWSWTSQGC